jgi:hypothetical protein
MLQHKLGLVYDWYQSHLAGGGARVGVGGSGRPCHAQTTLTAEIVKVYKACSALSQQLSYARQMPYFVERLSKIPGVFEIIRELPVRDANSCRLILKPGLLFINHTFYIRSWSFIAG